MRRAISPMIRSAFMLALLLGMGTISSVQVQAAGPAPQKTPAGMAIASPPPAGVPAAAGAGWYDGVIQWSTITNCVSIIDGTPYQEYGAGTYAGYYANPGAGLPIPNMTYYVHVVIEAVGNACSGQYGYVDIGLPANTSLAISGTNPVYCFANGVRDIPDCPQTLPTSPYHAGMYDIEAPGTNHVWPMPIGKPWEFQIPVVSTTTLSNSTFQAAVWVLDGNDSPWLNPTEGVYVFAPPPPGAFNKSGPGNGATSQPTSLNLSWGASSGATSYEYCLDTINNNACDSAWVSTGTATSKALSGLAAGSPYYWQVRANNGGGSTYANGSSTAYWSFTTALAPPAAFNNSGPANGAIKQSSSPTLSWGASSGATSYEYCLDTINNNACDSAWVSTGTATSKALSGLAHGSPYYWQVRANNTGGSTYANGSSTAYWSFSTLAVPGAFNKASPANAASKQSSSPTLKWGISSGATSYEYCIDTNNNNTCNTAWVSVGAATGKALSGLAHGIHYYWQVRAKNSAGYSYANGSSTAWWSFTTLALPAAFNKSTPAKGATNQATNPTLKWGASSGATSYQYCIDTSNNNTCNTAWISVGAATGKALSGMAHGGHYYWQVRAQNAAGFTYSNGSSTAWWSFLVH